MVSSAAALQNVVIERQTSKGYTWVRCIECWTSDPSSARFFPERSTQYDTMPAAYFTELVAYDPDTGWHLRPVKFIGDDAENLFFLLKEKGQIALVSCEGHLMTKSFTTNDKSARVITTIVVKQGTTRVHTVVGQGARPDSQSIEDYANKAMQEIEPLAQEQAQSHAPTAVDEPLWPSIHDASIDEAEETPPLDGAPF